MQVGMDTPDIQRAKKAHEIASQVGAAADHNASITFTVKHNGPLKCVLTKSF